MNERSSTPPSGTVTFFFTDIEGSTRIAQRHPAGWPATKARHHAILQSAIESHGGHVFQIIGDAFCGAFFTAPEALASALDAQGGLHAEPWGETPIRVRMGLHTGTATLRPGGDYDGYLAMATVQRVMSIAYGGQTLLSNATAGLLAGQLPEGVTLRDMGEHRLKSLLNPEHLWQVVAPDLPADFPPLQSLNTMPNNLPLQVTSFIGREKEIAEVKRLLATTRLLTLTGSGGTGKTRLALQVAADKLDQYADGVWFVELAPLTDPALAAQSVASALRVNEQPGRTISATLMEHLRDKHLLLILDNCEHLIDACARLADHLLRAGPQLTILATSREPLGIAGEMAWRVPSLQIPDLRSKLAAAELAQFEGIRLFIERARFGRGEFDLTDANAPAVAQICYRLDGIPLAIELAAARARAFTPEQLVARLDDRFQLLTGGSRTALRRQQTLRAAIDWSYDLLTADEQRLLSRLSVFAGGWTLAASETICGFAPLRSRQIADLLARLADQSLVAAEERDGAMRYRMLESLRQYGAEKLALADETDAASAQHLSYFVAFATQAREGLWSHEDVQWMKRTGDDFDNLRAAFDRAIAQQSSDQALRMIGVFFWYGLFFFSQNVREAMTRARAALSLPGAAKRDALHAEGLLAIGGSLTWSGGTDSAEGAAMLREAAQIAHACDADRIAAEALLHLGAAESTLRRFPEAMAAIDESLLAARKVGNGNIEGLAYVYRGMAQFELGQASDARESLRTGDGILARVGNVQMRMMTMRYDGYASLALGDLDAARASFRHSLEQNVYMTHDPKGTAACLAAYGALALQSGQPARAARLCASVHALLDRVAGDMFPFDMRQCDLATKTARDRLGDEAFAREWTKGLGFSTEEAVAEAERESEQALLLDGPPATLASPGGPALAAGLTAREVIVLRLLAQGLTDAQIAEKLAVSMRTVNSHLRSIYRKLDVTTRTAAARRVAELDLK